MERQVTVQDKISEIMSESPLYIEPDATLREVATMLFKNGVGAVLIEPDSDAQGIVTERDIVGALAEGADPDEVWSSDVMTSPVITVQSSAPIVEVAEDLVSYGMRHVVVMENNQVVGIVSARDVLEVLAGRLFDLLYRSIPLNA